MILPRDGFKRETREVTSSDELGLRLARSGGALVKLTPGRVAAQGLR